MANTISKKYVIDLSAQDVVIPNNESLSDAIDLRGMQPLAIEMPSSWTAANLTFQVSFDGTTYNNLYDAYGVETVVVSAASRFISLGVLFFFGVMYLKIRSGTSGTPVAQVGARTLVLQVRPI